MDVIEFVNSLGAGLQTKYIINHVLNFSTEKYIISFLKKNPKYLKSP
jgi:hypothetical protein